MSEEQGTESTSRNLFKVFNIKLKGSTKLETAENYSITGIFVGAIIFVIGVGLTSISTTGISALFAILGSFLSFIFTIILIVVWLVKEIKSD